MPSVFKNMFRIMCNRMFSTTKNDLSVDRTERIELRVEGDDLCRVDIPYLIFLTSKLSRCMGDHGLKARGAYV